MRVLKYLALVIVLLVSVALPLGSVSADSGRQQIRILTRAAAGHRDGAAVSKTPANTQQLAPLTGALRPPQDGAKRYAIVIGSNYTSIPDSVNIAPFIPPFGPHLNWAANDAIAMSGLLTAFGFDRVTTLVGPGPTGASRANILKAIQAVRRQAGENDEVVFYFSGHGAQLLRTEDGKGWGVASEGIVTDEGNKVDFLWDRNLAESFKDFETNRIVFIFDECLSGGMTELAGQGRLVLAATAKDGIAVEDAGPNDPGYMGIDHGFFTFFLLAALSGNASQADALVGAVMGSPVQNPYEPGAGAVSIEQAFDYASWDIQAVSPLVYGGLAYYYGPTIAGYWNTPRIIDGFRGDLVL